MKTRLVASVVLVAEMLCAGDFHDWKGKCVIFLGDSITDAHHIGCATNYWGFLETRMGFQAHVYGINGWQMNGIPVQLETARHELGDKVDAVFIFAGTNDFNGDVPLGDSFSYDEDEICKNGKTVRLKRRTPSFDAGTFCGRLNMSLRAVKTTYPRAQVVLLTPLHRGYAEFGKTNVQPDERYANAQGLYIDDYVSAVRAAGQRWSVPVIDLYSECGILPTLAEYDDCVAHPSRDRLHPSTVGHERLARVLEMRLLTMPSTMK